MLDWLFTPEKQWQRMYKVHQLARTHSYVNILWTFFTSSLALYFGSFLFFKETSVSCIAAKVPGEELKFVRFSSMSVLNPELLN